RVKRGGGWHETHTLPDEAAMTPLRNGLTLAVWLLALAWATAEEPKDKPNVKLTDEEKAILDLTNEARAKEKLPPLKPIGTLTEVARGHSANMAKQRKVEHELDGKKPKDRVKATGYPVDGVGENIVGQAGLKPEEAFKSWMKSPAHRKNILEP